MRAALVVMAMLGAGCVTPGAVQCGDGRTCPEGTTCDDVRSLCLTPAQTTACAGIDDGDVCIADGTQGICDRSFCEPGCGDGTTDPNEQCDDGNFASHDGCSSRCLVEVPTWVPVRTAWPGMSGHAAAYHAALGRTVIVGGLYEDGRSARIWQRDPSKDGDLDRGWREVTAAFPEDARPSARNAALVAYDPVRDVLVLHGGNGRSNITVDAILDDTWEYAVSGNTFDGEPVGTWTQVTSTPRPNSRFNAAMAFDHNLDKVVLLGGLDATTLSLSNEMWTYDGAWQTFEASPAAPFRHRHSLAFDEARNVLVLLGGSLAGATIPVHEFDGTGWSPVSSAGGPTNRRSVNVAYDPARSKLVVYGGTFGTSFDPASETWEYAGTWQLLSTPFEPAPRRSAAFVAEPDGLVLAGGSTINEGETFDDVWRLIGETWSEITPRFGPDALMSSAAVYDPDRGLVATGGFRGQSSLTEVWTFNGVSWSHEPDLPVARYGHSLTRDPTSGRLHLVGGYCEPGEACETSGSGASGAVFALDTAWSWSELAYLDPTMQRTEHTAVWTGDHLMAFCGYDGNFALRNDTSVFDGTSWRLLPSAAHPACETRIAAAWDPVREVVLALDANGDTWEYREETWTLVVPASAATPPGRFLAGLTYDSSRRRFVLAGGYATGGPRSDIWELDPDTLAWSELFVSGVSPLPRYDALLVAHPRARSIVLHGGNAGTLLTQGDTWQLRFLSTTPDETCGDNEDSDNDAQPDSEDPDCNPLPPSP